MVMMSLGSTGVIHEYTHQRMFTSHGTAERLITIVQGIDIRMLGSLANCVYRDSTCSYLGTVNSMQPIEKLLEDRAQFVIQSSLAGKDGVST